MNPVAEKELKLEDLPLELLFKIVGFLDRRDLLSMMKVSQKFEEISTNERFWKKIQIDRVSDSIDYVRELARHCLLLEELSSTSIIVFEKFVIRGEGHDLPKLDLLRSFGD